MISYTVSEINKFIKQIFSYEQIFYNISVKGEISNFKFHDSGNLFFTLKDSNSSIKCVMFKIQADLIDFLPENGMYVIVRGDITVYEKVGTYQIYVSNIKKQGKGLFQQEFINLHKKLMNEGLFDSGNKISIVKIPKVVGVITAVNGAALQDVIQILSRRLPVLKLKVFSCLVQGVGATQSIIKAIKQVSYDDEVDNVIICRGGGSEEDLNPFNDEEVCRAAFKCKKPIISAIGHETDHCLLDLVVDLRAPTPSAAAELVCVDRLELSNKIKNSERFLKNHIISLIEKKCLLLQNIKHRLECLSPKNFINSLEFRINNFLEMMKKIVREIILKLELNVEKNYNILKFFNPFNVLNKGYCLAVSCENRKQTVKSVYKIKKDDELILIFNKGEVKVKVLGKKLKRKELIF